MTASKIHCKCSTAWMADNNLKDTVLDFGFDVDVQSHVSKLGCCFGMVHILRFFLFLQHMIAFL